MTREMILGCLDPDLACAIALGFVENHQVVANLGAVTVHDVAMRPLGTKPDWLNGDDPLDAATREYLSARRDALLAGSRGPGASAWGAAGIARKRDEANRKALEARARARQLLEERGVLEGARAAGFRVVA